MSKILVADDSKITQEAYVRMLELLNYEVVVCGNGRQAVSRFKETQPDLVILDIDMPELNGFDACREIRKTPCGLNVPVIMVSSGESEEDIVKGINAGANDYLIKPVKDALLSAKLKTFLSFSRLVNKADLDLVQNHVEIADRYIIEKLLGHGAHSVVFLAKDRETGDQVAVKLVTTPEVENFSRAFVETLGKIEKIESPNVLKVHDFGKYAGRFYIILEFVENGDLSKLLKQRKLSEKEAVKMALDLISGLKEFDKHGIVHFDIKPENIMISDTAYTLGDFGIAALRETGTTPIKTELWSTAAYLPPEYLSDSPKFSSKSDIYSLGITLYQAITGDNPFQSDKPSMSMFKQINLVPPSLETCDSRISKYFSNTVASMMDKNPDSRPRLNRIERVFKYMLEFPEASPHEVEKEALPDEDPKIAETEPVAPAVTTIPHIAATATTPAAATSPTAPGTPASPAKPHRSILPGLTFTKFGFTKSLSLIALAAVLSAASAFLLYKLVSDSGKLSPPGALASVICLKCQNAYETRVIDIKNSKCAKCSGPIAYRLRCGKCKFEFPRKSSDTASDNYKYLSAEALAGINACPKCASLNTEPVPTSLEIKRASGGK